MAEPPIQQAIKRPLAPSLSEAKGDPTLLRDSPSVHKACNNCRAKKVKCTGQILGCERCEALDIQCTYLTDRERRRRTSIDDAGAKKHANAKQARVLRPPQPRRPAEGTEKSPMAGRAEAPSTDVMSLTKPDLYDRTEPLGLLIDGNDDESTFTADVEHWPLFPVFTGDAENWPMFPVDDVSLTEQPTTRDGSVYASAPSTSLPGDGIIFWDDTLASATDSGGENSNSFESRATPASNSTTNSTNSQQYAQTQTPIQVNVPAQAQVQGREQTQGPEQAACKCMQRIVFLINELETRLNNEDEDSKLLHKANDLDSALGLHKEAVRYGESMRQCRQCLSRAEKRMLLLLLANRLVVLCAHMVSVSRHIAPTSASGGPRARSYDLAIAITVGEYEVDSAIEGGVVLCGLIAFQLRALHSFITSLANNHEPQGAEFAAAKNKVIALMRRLQQSSVSFMAEPSLVS